jgi:hypothetical protein
MQNALNWGLRANDVGFVNLYSYVAETAPFSDGRREYVLDYPPMRLLTFDIWAKWLGHEGLDSPVWQPLFNVNMPLLLFNMAMELASAIAVFFLVRRWARPGRGFSSTGVGYLAAAFLWFNPAVILNSWGQPTWDVWVLPFYLYALIFASSGQWFACGLLLAVGATFKGQLLAVVPIFLLWPTFAGNLRGAAQCSAGFLLGFAVVVSPWMITRPEAFAGLVQRRPDYRAIIWISCLVIWTVMAIATAKAAGRSMRSCAQLACAGLGLVICFMAGMGWKIHLATAIVLSVCFLGLRRISNRWFLICVSTVAAAGLFSCVLLFHGTIDWYRIAYIYGAERFPELEQGNADSLAGLLAANYGWRSEDIVAKFPSHLLFGFPKSIFNLTISAALVISYALSLFICSFAIASLHRRRDPRWLVGATTPWLLFFSLMPHMHERYLLWGSAVGAIVVGVNFGWILLVALLSSITWMMTIGSMFASGSPDGFGRSLGPHFGQDLNQLILKSYPAAAWPVLLCTCIFLYFTLSAAMGKNSLQNKNSRLG